MFYLSEYQVFENSQELNVHMKQHINRYRYDLNKTQVAVLNFIARYSVKYAGASHLKTETIEQGTGKSKRTIQRVLSVLKSLRILEVIPTTRSKSGGKGANIYRILPFDTSEMSPREESAEPTESETEAANTPKETGESINLNNNSLNKRSNSAVTNAHNKPLYRQFKDFVALFMPDDKRLLYRLYGAYKAQVKPLEGVYDSEVLTDLALGSLKALFSAMKSKKLRNPVGYFSGTVKRKLDDMYEGLIAELYGVSE